MSAVQPFTTEQPSASPPVRVLVVDDSVVVRSLLQRWLTGLDTVDVAGMAADGQQALQFLEKTDVDVVVLDIAMPIMDGLAALPHIKKRQPHAQIIISSTLTTRNAEISLQALEQGAADYVTKPSGKTVVLQGQDFFAELLEKILALGAASQRKKLAGDSPESRPAPPRAPQMPKADRAPMGVAAVPVRPSIRPLSPEILAIGSSTGGPQALFRLLSDLPKPFPLPIVIVQHMPPIFTDILAQQLTRSTAIETREAVDGQPLLAGVAYMAPGDFHMRVVRDGNVVKLALSQDAPINYCRPAVDPLFESLADVYGNRVMALVLTGMGKDGLAGTRILAGRGATILAQDEESSVVWGMPGAVAKAGLAQDILPLDKIAAAVAKRLPGLDA
jgi:two-component system, chemotaxis family, protein-glutamate methylesterase/glutaminase